MSNNVVKGTSRMSSNDKHWLRDLWVANKDNPLEKKRTRRSLTQTEKAARQCMPTERAEQAIKSLKKKQKREVTTRFEAQPTDDAIAVNCIQKDDWLDFCERQEALVKDYCVAKKYESAVRAKNKSKKKSQSVSYAAAMVDPICAAFTSKQTGNPANNKSICFIHTMQHKRFQNYRQKRAELLASQKSTLIDADLIANCYKKSETNSAEQFVSADFGSEKRIKLEHMHGHETVQHALIDIDCDGCGKKLSSAEAVTADMRLFYHTKCSPDNPLQKAQKHNIFVSERH